MKTIFTTILLLSALLFNAQCGFVMPDNSTVCIGVPFTLKATGAASYTWSMNGLGYYNIVNPSDTSNFTFSYTQNRQVKIIGILSGCQEIKTITITVEQCEVGIKEWQNNSTVPSIYFDLMGNTTEFKTGEVMIEHRGVYYRKVRVD